MNNRAYDWYKQAVNDLTWAQDSLKSGYWAQVCFVCQQVAEKALKAIALSRGALEIKSHSLVRIAEALGVNGDIERMGRRLDVYYITSRYPDAFAEGSPFEYFDREQAEEALGFAAAFISKAELEIKDGR
jgi:HEPN domain-containing protein